MGVRTYYKAFAKDTTFEIVRDDDPQNLTRFKAVRTHCRWEPRPSDANNNVGGMYTLQSVPWGDIGPASFVPGSRAIAETTVREFRSAFPGKSDAIQDWMKFLHDAPENDDVWDYVRREGGFHVPLYDRLFKSDCDEQSADQGVMDVEDSFRPDPSSILPSTDDLQDISATPSVQWSARGIPQPFYTPRVNNSSGVDIDAALLSAASEVQDYSQMTINHLRHLCRTRGLKVSAKDKEGYVRR